ncbi:MAG: hypothetical protein C4563_05095 [Desulfobulbus sp.]|nr:MAG: hypothetical protein C4563_05095 [Desulfobulbus sp.]
MTEEREDSRCQLCGATKKTHNLDNISVCTSCKTVMTTVKSHPEVIKNAWRLYHDEPILPQPGGSEPRETIELPDVVDGKRYRAVDREQNKWYLSVSEVDGNPVEVFASTAFDRNHELQSRISNLTTITRLISLILRHIFLYEPLTLDKCLKQIQRSSRQKNDLPDMLYGVLSRYRKGPEETERNNQII